MQPNRHREDVEENDHAGLTTTQQDPLIKVLHRIISYAVRALSVLMALVILWGVADVVYVLYQRLVQPPLLMLEIQDLLATFGAFLAVLIAIEIFINITLYLRDDVIHVKLVIATALMAVARKVIVFDYQTLDPGYIWATGALLIALGITYWLVAWKHPRKVLLRQEYTDEPRGR
ncbi:phosphate-starvation-inducible PsiE family protein [Thiohalomonas denitrificans]|uniref:phosphate-starvation-inducible PsiE family protein n=1 Tax=Thiohalomonas denitrificans TaxID=415747 RepID=UPI0026F3409B|nr:phosphate-starvation-inducible PsiE family protein [Thiohalomonas denitrificans]